MRLSQIRACKYSWSQIQVIVPKSIRFRVIPLSNPSIQRVPKVKSCANGLLQMFSWFPEVKSVETGFRRLTANSWAELHWIQRFQMWLSWFSKFKLVAVRFKLVAKLVAKVIFVPDPTVHSKMAAKCLSRFLVSLQCSKENFPRFYLPSSRLQCSSAIYPIQSSR